MDDWEYDDEKEAQHVRVFNWVVGAIGALLVLAYVFCLWQGGK